MSARFLPAAAAALGMAVSGVALAQEDVGEGAQAGPMQAPDDIQVAEECLSELEELNAQLLDTGYVPPPPTGYGVTAVEPAYPIAYSPRNELFILRNAARVLAFNGNADACRTVVSAMWDIHEEYEAMLAEDATNRPLDGDWRLERLQLAEPVTSLDVTWRTDEIAGTDVRNVRGEWLGEVEDVVMTSEGDLSFVLLERGGFLDLGDELVPVPWDMLSVTPDLLTFVVDVPEGIAEGAPAFESAAMLEAAEEDWRQTVRTYWEEHAGG
jgi:hypothetical protein